MIADSPRIQELRRRVHEDPASIAFAQLAEEYRRAGRFEEAVEVCRAGLTRHPSYLSARVTLGRALIELGELEATDVVVDPADYGVVLEEIRAGGGVTDATRFRLAKKVFAHTAAYDGAITNYLSSLDAENRRRPYPDVLNLQFVKRQEMRYGEQVFEVDVPLDGLGWDEAGIAQRVEERFHQRHEELYTYAERHNAVEVVNIESTLYGRIDKPKAPRLGKGATVAKALKGHRKAIFEASGKATKTPIYDGDKLGAGAVIAGPAIIEEVTTTIVIEPGWSAKLDASGSYVITRKGKKK